ncbi:MAG: hypothetical protein E7Z98_09735, partial [Olsenella sp.]|nr:hypothetical protein [Olsenella sp.]
MATLKEIFIERAQAKCPTIIFPEGENETVAKSAVASAELGICKSVLVGDTATIKDIVGDADVTIVDIDANPAQVEELAQIYADREDFPVEVAIDMLTNKINFAAMYVAAGKADGIVCGHTVPTAEAVLAAQEYIGLAEGATMPNAYVIVEPEHFEGGEDNRLIYADPVMVVQ